MPSAAAWLLALSLALALPGLAQADDLTPQKRADIRQLIGVDGGVKLSGQLVAATGRSIEATLRKTRPGIPDRVFVTLNRDLTTFFEAQVDTKGGLLDRIVAVYDKHFTHPEIKELLAFNQTPTGRKTMQLMPVLMSESMAAGRAWGRSLAPEVQRRVDAVLKQEGVEAPAKK
jgi:uncharacterized protein